MKTPVFASILFFLVAFTANATHNRAGEIVYRHISGNTYEFTVKTCTKTTAPADRPFLPIDWGDGSPGDSLERVTILPNISFDAQQNTYIKRHTFPGSGNYSICVSDPNRNGGILNIENSILIPFALRTTLRISASFLPNNSVVFQNTCLQDACLFQPWVFNPGAVDQDGLDATSSSDSLSFKFVHGLDAGCVPLPSEIYAFPNQLPLNNPPNNTLSMDPITGTIIWNYPQAIGEYNLAFIVEEWRNGLLIGTVLRDMQITVDACNNQPPTLEAIRDTCIDAGSTLTFQVLSDDPNGDNVLIEGFGSPFLVSSSPADLFQPGMLTPTVATFQWNTNCTHVQLDPYQTTFQAKDVGSGFDLVAIETMKITVVAPAPENLVAEASGNLINLTWEPSICSEAIGYKIYRRINPFGYVPSPCETGVPEYTGYTLINTIEGVNTTDYTDLDEVIFGRQNCYMVVACFADGAQSYASNESCAEIKFEIPIIKKNSVGVTSESSGVDTVFWRSPIELDSVAFSGPYQYKLYRSIGYGEPDDEVFVSSEESNLENLPNSFISTDLNSVDSAHTYRVELYSDGVLAAKSNTTSSLFINLIPDDNQIAITWVEDIPWINYSYDIYRQTDGTGSFELIATDTELGYVDSGLINLKTYCYYIVSKGSYFAIEENDTLINFSQRACSQPYDRTPPCPPILAGESDCVEFTVDLAWTNPNESCLETDDVIAYNIYFTNVQDATYTLLQSMQGDLPTDLSLIFDNSIAGCYVVTALDSLSPRPNGELVQNESVFSNPICFDNCPKYDLPNVFTPNGDGRNDLFQPLSYRSVASVDFTIFNRWGAVVFQTNDPEVNWDGVSTEEGKLVSDGTYFFTARVFAIRLFELDPINLSGYFQVFGRAGSNGE